MNHRLAVVAVMLLVSPACLAAGMQEVRVSADHKGFVLSPSGNRFVPWGHNYAAQGLEDASERSWAKIESDLIDLKNMRANVIRIHLQFAQFMDGPDAPNAKAWLASRSC